MIVLIETCDANIIGFRMNDALLKRLQQYSDILKKKLVELAGFKDDTIFAFEGEWTEKTARVVAKHFTGHELDYGAVVNELSVNFSSSAENSFMFQNESIIYVECVDEEVRHRTIGVGLFFKPLKESYEKKPPILMISFDDKHKPIYPEE